MLLFLHLSTILTEAHKVGDKVESGSEADIKPGNALKLEDIPVGTFIHAIELYPGKGAQLVRSAGNQAQLMGKEGAYALIRLPSGEMRKVPIGCKAAIGQVSNIDHENVNYGKAGRVRNMGWRPTVRGSVMNPCDHPHGGGEGKSPVGRPGPVTPWGKPALGYKTRKGTLCPGGSSEESCGYERGRRKEGSQDMEPFFNNFP